MQRPWKRQDKFRNRHVEAVPIFGDTEITAFHAALRRRQRTTATVFKALTWLQQGLMADYAQALHFLHLVFGIRDHPVTRNQLCCHSTGIFDRDRIGKHVIVAIRIRLI